MSGNFIRDDEAQAAIIAYLKTKTALTSLLADTTEEVREQEWQGTDFSYPNVRVRIISNIPASKTCYQTVEISCIAFSESPSSLEAQKISGTIGEILHDRSFFSTNIGFHLVVTNQLRALRTDERTWRSEILLRGTMFG